MREHAVHQPPSDEQRVQRDGQASEAQLVERLRRGDERAFEELARDNAGRLYAMAYRMLRHEHDAQEAVQEAMLGALRGIADFDARSRLSTWLTRIVINKCLMRLRSKRRRPEVAMDALLPTFKDDGHPTQWTSHWQTPVFAGIDDDLVRLLREKIDELPDAYREVLLLRDVQQLSTEDVANALGDTPNAVKVRLHRARQALRALLDPHVRDPRSHGAQEDA